MLENFLTSLTLHLKRVNVRQNNATLSNCYGGYTSAQGKKSVHAYVQGEESHPWGASPGASLFAVIFLHTVANKQTNKQTDNQTSKQTNKQTKKQTNKHCKAEGRSAALCVSLFFLFLFRSNFAAIEQFFERVQPTYHVTNIIVWLAL